MQLTDIVDFWSRLRGTVHPNDETVLACYPGLLNLDYPPQAYIGDICQAPIIILMCNGGYKSDETPREFARSGTAERHRQRLCHPLPIEPEWVAPYYLKGKRGEYLLTGRAAVVNAVAYRSPDTRDKRLSRMATELPSTQLHRRWLLEAVAPLVKEHRRAVIVHRWGLWDLPAGLRESPGFCPTAPRPELPSNDSWTAAERWLN